MKIRNFIVIVLILNSINAYSQKVFRDGFIIKNNGDTLNGLVQFYVKKTIADKCIFKRFDIASVVLYSPEQIKGFGYKDGNYYETHLVNGNRVFLECIIKGNISLYKYKKQLFVSKENKQLIELRSELVVAEKNSAPYTYSNVAEFFKNYTEDRKGVNVPENLEVNENSIASIVKDFNGKDSSAYKEFNRTYTNSDFVSDAIMEGRNALTYGVINASRFSTTILESQPITYRFPKATSMSQFKSAWTFGVFSNYQLSRVSQSWYVQLELLYYRQNSYIYQVLYQAFPSQTHRIDLNYTMSSLSMPIAFRYKFPVKGISSFIDFGFSFDYIFRNYGRASLEVENDLHEVRTYYTDQFNKKINELRVLSPFIGFGFSFNVFDMRHLNVAARYNLGSMLEQEVTFDYSSSPVLMLTHDKFLFSLMISIGI